MALTWLACDFKTGARLWPVATEKLGEVSRFIGEDRPANVEVRWSDRGKELAGVREGTAPGRVMLVVVDEDDDRILFGALTRRRQRSITGSSATAVCDTLEAYFRRRYINAPFSQTNTDVSTIAAAALATITDIPIVVDATPTGTLVSVFYDSSDNKTIRSILDDLAGLAGGIEWTVEVEWTDAEHTAIRYRVRIGPRLGSINNGRRWVLQPDVDGPITDGTYIEDYSPDTGANDTLAYSSGEGDSQPLSTRYVADDLLAGGWARFERRFSPATSITSTSTLDKYAEADHAETRIGIEQLTIVANLDAAPRLNLDWWLGDTISVDITSDTFPARQGDDGQIPGFSADMRVIGWTLNLDSRTLHAPDEGARVKKIVVQSLDDVARVIQRLQEQIDGLRSERRAGSTSVDSGSFRVTADGAEIFRIGDMEFGDRGLVIRRQDGTVALAMKRLSADSFVGQSVAIYDGSGNTVLSTDALLQGLRAPYFEIPFQPYSATPGTSITCGPYGFERTTTSGTFETVFVYDGKRQNVFLDAKVAARASDATTTGEVRIVNLATGTPLPDFFGGPSWVGTVPTSSTSYLVLDPGASQAVTASSGGFGSYMRLGVQARRTAGTGTLTIAVPSALGG